MVWIEPFFSPQRTQRKTAEITEDRFLCVLGIHLYVLCGEKDGATPPRPIAA